MKKTVNKLIAVGLCSTMTFGTLAYVAPIASAQEVTSNVDVGTNRQKADTEVLSKIPKGNAYVPKNTMLEVELTHDIDSKHNKTGDPIILRLVDNLIINDVIVAPAGSEVEGVITKSRKAGGLGRSGRLEFQINSLKTINNVEIPLAYDQKDKGETAGGAGVVFAAVSIVGGLFMKGKNVNVKAGTKFDCRVTTDTDLKVKLTDLKEAMNPDKPHGVAIKI